MATTRLHLNSRGVPHLVRLAVVAFALFAAVSLPSPAQAYGWPVKPFDRQHPVRGMFGDPRIGDGAEHSQSFHFGVDVSAPDGTAVYATVTGTAVLDPANSQVVDIRPAHDASLVFSYWHVVPAVHDGQFVVARRTVIGHIARGWEHVHFAEQRDGRHINPLRGGAMAPYADRTQPWIHTLSVERDGRAVGHAAVHHNVELVAEVGDTTPLAIAGRWHDRPVMPAVVRWRLRAHAGGAGGWRTAVDFRMTIPADDRVEETYARWTRQNKPWRNGRYRIVLTRRLAVERLRPGVYAVELAVTDLGGNVSLRRFGLVVGRSRIVLADR